MNEPMAMPTGPPSVDGGDDGDARREVAEHLAELGGVERGRRRACVGLIGAGCGAQTWRLGRASSSDTVRPSAAAMTSTPVPARGVRASASMRSTSASSCAGSWWNSASRLAPGLRGDLHGVVDGAVAPVALLRELVGRVLRVVDQQVDAVAQLEHGVGDVATLPSTRLLVVADVGDRGAVPARCGSRWWRRRGAPARTVTLASPIARSSSLDVVEADVAGQVARRAPGSTAGA